MLEMNRTLQEGLGLRRGVSHTEFIRGQWRTVGWFVFLETSARVGGAFIVDTDRGGDRHQPVAEWAKVEIAGEHGEYAVPPHRDDYAGIVLSLARQEAPDMSAYTDPEIVTTIRKDHHAGLIVRSPEPQRVEALIADYTQRFYRDFFATAPPPERPVE